MKITKEQQVLQQVINEAWENAEFKKELIANPVAAIEALTGEKLNIPEGKTFVVRDQTDESTVYINIPAEQKLEDVELNEEQLEAVAGGNVFLPYSGPFVGLLGLGAGGLKNPSDITIIQQNS
ncbi:NHLP leader peptide family RiPP precursor [Polaribacter sp. Q13]|uniref:NHLP leader peptide family RiPP precursor n=1 Tax=Polaribacter sp. Q13 TaxID=2806551 RepID=UPI00193B978C|nr:NHLP leader peptide family RiPP precursor [Polaribacter sp. Q13]QVY64639.1 NHLP leader peptide family RiPP precursor [Polaribacter sp. Q13]